MQTQGGVNKMREVTVTEENRTDKVGAGNRTVTPGEENRTLNVSAETRTIKPARGSRTIEADKDNGPHHV